MNLKIAIDVPEDEFYIGMIRQIGRTLLEHHDCIADDADDLELIIGELCSNVTRHARSEKACYYVALEYHEDHVVVIVADQGQGFQVDEIAPMGTPRQVQDKDDAVRYGGFGLHLVGTLADHMDIQPSEPTGTTVRVQKYLTGPQGQNERTNIGYNPRQQSFEKSL